MRTPGGRPINRGRHRAWGATILAASLCSCLSHESSLVVTAAVLASSAARQTAAGWASGGAPHGKDGEGGWRGASGGAIAEAAARDPNTADRGEPGRGPRGRRKVAPAAATAAAAALPENRRGKIGSFGAPASSPDDERRPRRRRASEVAESVGNTSYGGPSRGGANRVLLTRGGGGDSGGLGRVRQRRAQSEGDGSVVDGTEEGGAGEEDEQAREQEETAAENELYGEEDDGVGSVGLMALVVCFGLLFCVMEVAKCYFLFECRRRRRWQRWRRRRAQENARRMPIASSRVVATDVDVPSGGSKDGWVEIVIDGVAMSNALPADKDMPSAPGYSVAGAAHALQEAIEHARRLSPHRSYSATIFPPSAATPEHSEILSPEIRPPETQSTDASPEIEPARLGCPHSASRTS